MGKNTIQMIFSVMLFFSFFWGANWARPIYADVELQDSGDAAELREHIESEGEEMDLGQEPDTRIKTEYAEENELDAEPEKLEDDKNTFFQKYVLGDLPEDISRKVDHFGYDFFDKLPTSFVPKVEAIPVHSDYVIGPGDEISLHVWGMVEGRWRLRVDRDGNIDIPKIGTVTLSGLKYGELEPYFRDKLAKHYSDFQLNVTMGRLRTIPVYLVGNVKKPGLYSIPSLSTLINALFQSGGPSKSGTLRSIHLIRDGEKIVEFDMYDFLLEGDKTKDARLQPEDVIFVPTVGPRTAVLGNVENPAIYELREGDKISRAIDMAGGVRATGFLERIHVERIYENESKKLVEKNLKDFHQEDDIELQDGDVIAIHNIKDALVNVVELKGNVQRPGFYEVKDGTRLSDIITNPDKDLKMETEFDFALIKRRIPPAYEQELIFFDLGRAVLENDKSEDVILKPADEITIFSKTELAGKPEVTIRGAVNKPDKYRFYPNMTVSDLIKLAGGLKYYAYRGETELTRVRPTPDGPEFKREFINLENAMKDHPDHNLELSRNDFIIVRPVPDWRLYDTVKITGEVQFSGTYTVKKGESLTSLISRAGGLTQDAYLRGTVFSRESVRERQREQIEEMVQRLEREVLAPRSLPADASETDARAHEQERRRLNRLISQMRDTEPDGRVVIAMQDKPGERLYDIELEDGDTLYIPRKPETVTVMGAVHNETAFVHDPGKRYRDYIDLAGGVTRHADRRRTYIIRVDGTVVQPNRRYRMQPGDAVVVPERIEIVRVRREVREILDILYKTAVTAAVSVNIFD